MAKKISPEATQAQYEALKRVIEECNAHMTLYRENLLHPAVLEQARDAIKLTDRPDGLWNTHD